MNIDAFTTKAHASLLAQAPQAEENGRVAAAVLVPVTEIGGEAAFGFIRRPKSVKRFAGQIAFPGGRIEHGETPLAAALRETEEEVGIKPDRVEIAGFIPALSTATTGFVVWPVVGIVHGAPAIHPAPEEVEQFFWAPASYFANPGNVVRRSEILKGESEPRRAFVYNGHEIWGLTFRIIVSLVERLQGRRMTAME